MRFLFSILDTFSKEMSKIEIQICQSIIREDFGQIVEVWIFNIGYSDPPFVKWSSNSVPNNKNRQSQPKNCQGSFSHSHSKQLGHFCKQC